jgi:hypothetical protein
MRVKYILTFILALNPLRQEDHQFAHSAIVALDLMLVLRLLLGYKMQELIATGTSIHLIRLSVKHMKSVATFHPVQLRTHCMRLALITCNDVLRVLFILRRC